MDVILVQSKDLHCSVVHFNLKFNTPKAQKAHYCLSRSPSVKQNRCTINNCLRCHKCDELISVKHTHTAGSELSNTDIPDVEGLYSSELLEELSRGEYFTLGTQSW